MTFKPFTIVLGVRRIDFSIKIKSIYLKVEVHQSIESKLQTEALMLSGEYK